MTAACLYKITEKLIERGMRREQMAKLHCLYIKNDVELLVDFQAILMEANIIPRTI